MHANGSRTFLVIPDAYDGGSNMEHFVVAHSPEEACELLRDRLDAEVQRFVFTPEVFGDHFEDLWVVRELPRVAPITHCVGVVPWESSSAHTGRRSRGTCSVTPGVTMKLDELKWEAWSDDDDLMRNLPFPWQAIFGDKNYPVWANYQRTKFSFGGGAGGWVWVGPLEAQCMIYHLLDNSGG